MKKTRGLILAGAICLVLFSFWALQTDSAFAGKANKGSITIDVTKDINVGTFQGGTTGSGRYWEEHSWESGTFNYGTWSATRAFLNPSGGAMSNQQAQDLYNFYTGAISSLPVNYEVGSAAGLSALAGGESGVLSYTQQLAHSTPGREYQFYSGSSTTSNATSAGVSGAFNSTATMGGGRFTVNVTNNVSGTMTTTQYSAWGYKYVSPLVLDMDGDGRLEASKGTWLPHPGQFRSEKNVAFDIDGNGFESLMEWVGPNDGLLVEPKADGTVDGSCLFGTAGGYLSGFEKLALRDTNRDAAITGSELAGLHVWQDANQNGVAEPDELQTIESLGITRLNLKHQNYLSTFVQKGKARRMWDWWPNSVALQKQG